MDWGAVTGRTSAVPVAGRGGRDSPARGDSDVAGDDEDVSLAGVDITNGTAERTVSWPPSAAEGDRKPPPAAFRPLPMLGRPRRDDTDEGRLLLAALCKGVALLLETGRTASSRTLRPSPSSSKLMPM